jgi:hypothetical protein
MFASIDFSQSTPRAISMLVAAAIVTAIVAIGAYVAQPTFNEGYSVTITQLQ